MTRHSAFIGALVAAMLLPTLGRTAGSTPAWKRVRTWAYQLQHPTVAEIASSPFDLVVIDYSQDGSTDSRFTKRQVTRMQRKPDGNRRLVIAYMSIGEAEPYRFYWKKGWRPGSPEWLLKPNPDWPDNYRVAYWHPDWQRIIFGSPGSYLDQIIDAGFDGVYLDIVDGYENFEKTRPQARTEMIALVRKIAGYARNTRGINDFGVFPQNAPELLENPTYLSVITGLGKEELFFIATDEATEDENREWDASLLSKAHEAGKLILLVDYCEQNRNVREAYIRSRTLGFIPYCSTVELDRLLLWNEPLLLNR